MKATRILAVLLGFSSTSFGWVLDKSCDGTYSDLVTNSMKNAFDLAEAGLETLSITNVASGDQAKWQAQMDLISFLFPSALTNGKIDWDNTDFQTLTTRFDKVIAYNKNPGGAPQARPANILVLNNPDLVVYCDYSRFNETQDCDGVKKKGITCDTSIGMAYPIDEIYSDCKSTSVFSTSSVSAWTMEWSTRQIKPINRASQIQICPSYLKSSLNAIVRGLPDQGKKANLARGFSKVGAWMDDPFRSAMDVASGLDATMLHELTHAIPFNGWTVDAAGPKNSYGWKNCVKMSPALGITNADHYAYFGLASRMISPTTGSGVTAQRPMKDGSIQVLPAAGAASGSKRTLPNLRRAPVSNVTLKIDHATVVLNNADATGFVFSEASSAPLTIAQGKAYTIGTDIVSLDGSAIIEDKSTILFPGALAPKSSASTSSSQSSSRPTTFSTSSRIQNPSNSNSLSQTSSGSSSLSVPSSISSAKSSGVSSSLNSGSSPSVSSTRVAGATSSAASISSLSTNSNSLSQSSASISAKQFSSQSLSSNGTASASASTSSSLSSSISSSASSSRTSSLAALITTTVVSGGSSFVETVTPPPSTDTAVLPILLFDWLKATPTTTSGVSSATHDSHGFPIIPFLHCWFCPPIGGGGGGIGFVIPGITGPGIIKPPPPGVNPPPGFSSNMPAITLDKAGDPTFDEDEPTKTASSTTNTQSSGSKSSSSSSRSCSARTVSACDTSLSVFIPSGGKTATTSTITLGCSTITACSASITGSTSTGNAVVSATPDGDYYNAWDTYYSDWLGAQQSVLAEAMADDTDDYVTWSPDEASSTVSGSVTSSANFTSASQTASPSSGLSSSLPSTTGSSSSINSTSASKIASLSKSSAPSTTATIITHSSPPITSCTYASVTAFSSNYPDYTINYPATIECTCNDGWQAVIGSTIGPDLATTYTCAIGNTFTGVSTAPAPVKPSSTYVPPPYQTGICNVHIFEASESYNAPLYIQLNVTDGGNNMLASENFDGAWGDTAVVKAADSKLPYDVTVDFLKSTKVSRRTEARKVKGRIVGPPPPVTVRWEDWVLKLTAGDTKWDDTMTTVTNPAPYCNVGGWDNGNFFDWFNSLVTLGLDSSSPNRQLDCHWTC